MAQVCSPGMRVLTVLRARLGVPVGAQGLLRRAQVRVVVTAVVAVDLEAPRAQALALLGLVLVVSIVAPPLVPLALGALAALAEPRVRVRVRDLQLKRLR